MRGPSIDIGTAAKVAFLKDPSNYSRPTRQVRAIETHMAWVFLTERYAFKMKKPIRLGRLDTRTLDDRERASRSEVELNRRLAPGVYLGRCAVRRGREGGLVLDEALEKQGSVVEWLVKMRRLPAEKMLDSRLRRPPDRHLRDQLRRLGEVLAAFYAGARRLAVPPETYRQRLRDIIDTAEEALRAAPPVVQQRRVRTIADRLREWVGAEADLFDARVQGGHVVEGHGDLRPEHVCLEYRPVVIDCLEFSPVLRAVDPVDELAFLSMECTRLGAGWAGQLVYQRYVAQTGDAPPGRLRAFYGAFRAFQRARLAVRHLHVHDERLPRSVWLRQANQYLGQAAIRLS
jgi:aminoglycoside phosphotransferase family enzyme